MWFPQVSEKKQLVRFYLRFSDRSVVINVHCYFNYGIWNQANVEIPKCNKIKHSLLSWQEGQPTCLIWEDITFIKIWSIIYEKDENLNCSPPVKQCNRLNNVQMIGEVKPLTRHWLQFLIKVPFTQNVLVARTWDLCPWYPCILNY